MNFFQKASTAQHCIPSCLPDPSMQWMSEKWDRLRLGEHSRDLGSKPDSRDPGTPGPTMDNTVGNYCQRASSHHKIEGKNANADEILLMIMICKQFCPKGAISQQYCYAWKSTSVSFNVMTISSSVWAPCLHVRSSSLELHL